MTTDAAAATLETLAERYTSAEHVLEYVNDERPRAQVSARDVLTTLRQEAALALVLDSTPSADVLASAPTEDGEARYEHWVYDKVSEAMGADEGDVRWTEEIGRRAAVELLEDRHLAFAMRRETPLDGGVGMIRTETGP